MSNEEFWKKIIPDEEIKSLYKDEYGREYMLAQDTKNKRYTLYGKKTNAGYFPIYARGIKKINDFIKINELKKIKI